MAEESEYININENGENTIEEEARIDVTNLKDITFEFGEVKEIGDKYIGSAVVSNVKRGRTAYSGAIVKYKDGKHTNNAGISNVIFHYSPAIEVANGSYGRKFISIGIRKEIISKIINDASKKLGVKVSVKRGTEEKNNHYWLSCNLEKLLESKTYTFIGDEVVNHSLFKLLEEAKFSFIGTGMFTIGITQTTENNDIAPDLVNGMYTITMKPTEVWLKSDTDIEGPIIVNRAKANETIQPTKDMETTGRLAQLLKRRLKV